MHSIREDESLMTDHDGWKRVMVTMAGVALATLVSVLILSFAAHANGAPAAPAVHGAER